MDRLRIVLYILGIESSCDDTGVSVVRDGVQVLSSLVSSQTEIHREFGGVVPEIASRAHAENLLPLVSKCLDESGVALDEVGAVAVTYTPGLVGCLLVGLSFAKSLAYSLNKPLIGVHHLEAHVYTVVLDREPNARPPFPHLSLLVSGGHTALYRVDGWTRLTYLGGTLDDAAGEAFDKVAKALGLGFPGGPIIQKTADGYDGEYIDFPRPILDRGYDFSYSGLKTAVINYLRSDNGSGGDVKKVAASFQYAAIDVLVQKTLRAAEEQGLSHISLTGGVSANQPLRDLLTEKAAEKGFTVHLPEKRFSVDNGAMIAGIAYHYFQENKLAGLALNANPS